LIVVGVLFFILAMVTAYAGRNLIFEQRTSVNNQRATQAFEMAEAGLEFAVTLLSGGRVDDACQPTTTTTQATFRQRHLTMNDGTFTLTGGQATLRPTCILPRVGDSRCSCPAASAPSLIEPVGLAPTLQLEFQSVAQPGLVRAVSRGCSSIGEQCYAASANGRADAVAEVSVLLGLNSALATPPSAALTARGTVNLNDYAVTVSNADVPSHGITIDAGGLVSNAGAARITSVPGTPGATSIRASDPSLSSLTTPDRMFKSVFGMDRVTYRSQPAVVRITCSGDCDSAIANAVSANPGRIIWVQGPATIDSNLVLGSVAEPVMLVVQGNLTVSANLQFFGVLYLHDTSGSNVWNTTAGSTLINGALVAEGNLSITGTPTISFDPNVLRTINLTQGSMVRVPGSWRDFAAGS
jgi:Tfp pilus assembly protein PilX